MKLTHFLLITIVLCLCSCSNEQEFCNLDNVKTKEFTIRNRDSRFPLELNYIPVNDSKTRSDITYQYQYLGHGFKPITLPLIDAANISSPIFDIDKIIEVGKNNQELDLKSSRLINSWLPDITTFTSFDSYAKSESVTKAVKGGFSLTNIPIVGKIFGFGSRKKYTEVFNSLIIDTTKSVYGKMEIIYRDSLHRIHMSESTYKDLSGLYNLRFKKDLYNMHMLDILNSYGYFVISGIETGGILTAMYQGTFTSHENYEYRSKTMSDSITATMSFKGVSGSADISIHKSKANASGSVKKYSAINISYRTFGGDFSSSRFTPPANIDNLSDISFDSWAQSLKDKSLLVVSQISEEGLVPIYDFLLEENFKEQAKRYTTVGISIPHMGLIEPFLYLETYGTIDMRFASLFLVTKYGDYIRIASAQLPGISITNAVVQSVFDSMIGKGKSFFSGLKVKAKHYYLTVPSPYDDKNITEVVASLPKKEFQFDTYNMASNISDYEYCTCKENNNIYMVCKKSKTAFTIAYDSIWIQYGIQKPIDINNLKQISLHDLVGYHLFGL
ncbi:MAC/perforin domain-containing protein [Bacteroides acidifaciens]|uniref:MAC/perforin domain-containing protein n=1 Tax=Bacteroides acidifaciens TaxID=85831 RepID=UPI00158E9740|nr:MAC/perforin domain-containing protein [Bacteroides acidifaciens]